MNPGSGAGGVQGPRPVTPPKTHPLPAAGSLAPLPLHPPRVPRRATGLPEKYCIEAERKANILPATSVS